MTNEIFKSLWQDLSTTSTSDAAGKRVATHPSSDFSCIMNKKCCEKYKKGKRCKKCPQR